MMMATNSGSLVGTADMAIDGNLPSAEELRKFFPVELKPLCDWLMQYLKISIPGSEKDFTSRWISSTSCRKLLICIWLVINMQRVPWLLNWSWLRIYYKLTMILYFNLILILNLFKIRILQKYLIKFLMISLLKIKLGKAKLKIILMRRIFKKSC